jgi:1,4-dihydroxy-2-naphthoate polyprenyltransferase
MQSKQQMTPMQIWMSASRPKTLPAAAAPVLAASALAWHDGLFHWGPALACLLTALLLQIAANLANDLFDFQRGTDTPDRLGPLRVTQAGLLTSNQVKAGLAVCFTLSALLGLYVAFVSSWLILLIGVFAIIAALAYSGGPLPYGYYGLGELGVFLFFGLAAVCGTYYGQAVTLTPAVFLIAAAMGFISTAILVVNNMRDIETDNAGGKRTLSVLFGRTFTKWEYCSLIGLGYFIPVILWLAGLSNPWIFLTFLSMPFAFRACLNVTRLTGRALNAVLAETGRLELLFAIFMSLGLIIGK